MVCVNTRSGMEKNTGPSYGGGILGFGLPTEDVSSGLEKFGRFIDWKRSVGVSVGIIKLPGGKNDELTTLPPSQSVIPAQSFTRS